MLMSMWLPMGVQLDPQVGRGQREVSGDVGELVSAGDLRVDQRGWVHDKRVAKRAAARFSVAPIPRCVDIVRRRVKRRVSVALEDPEKQSCACRCGRNRACRCPAYPFSGWEMV